MKVRCSVTTVLLFEASTGLTTSEELRKLVSANFQIIKLLGPMGDDSLIHSGVIHIMDSRGFSEEFVKYPHFVGGARVGFKIAAREEELEAGLPPLLFCTIFSKSVFLSNVESYMSKFGRIEWIKFIDKGKNPKSRFVQVQMNSRDSMLRVLAVKNHRLDGVAMKCLEYRLTNMAQVRSERKRGDPIITAKEARRSPYPVDYSNLKVLLGHYELNLEYLKRNVLKPSDPNLRIRLRHEDTLLYQQAGASQKGPGHQPREQTQFRGIPGLRKESYIIRNYDERNISRMPGHSKRNKYNTIANQGTTNGISNWKVNMEHESIDGKRGRGET